MRKINKILSKKELSNEYEYPAYSSDSTNNGIIGYTNNPEFICDRNTPVYITFGDHTRTMNIAKKSFSVLDNVKVLVPYTNDERVLLYIISTWKKQIPNLGYARHWKIAKNCILKLPTKNGEIDFKFINSYIAELEALRIAELEAYLLATGLKDYTLTPPEKSAIERLEKTEFKEYSISDIFEFKNTFNILSSDIVKDSGKTPYLCASAENNAVNSYITYDKKYLEKGNCIFIGGKTFVVSYQEQDFYSNDSHNLALYVKNTEKTKKKQLYLATCIYKSLKHKYSWGNSISKAKIKSDKILVPTVNGKIDFNGMETLISAIQKLVIKDVVLYADRKISATKAVVSAKD